jgi:hypothetical protein
LSKLLVLFSRLADGVKQIHVCNASVNKTDDLFDYGIQLIDSYANSVKDYNLVLIGEHYWEVDISGGFAKLSFIYRVLKIFLLTEFFKWLFIIFLSVTENQILLLYRIFRCNENFIFL